jgi:hypothetical protein
MDFSTTVDIFLAIDTARKAIRIRSHNPDYARPSLKLVREGVSVHLKADRASQLVATTPPRVSEVWADFHTVGLDGGGPYWFVSNMEEQKPPFSGYIHDDDVE